MKKTYVIDALKYHKLKNETEIELEDCDFKLSKHMTIYFNDCSIKSLGNTIYFDSLSESEFVELFKHLNK